MPPTSFDSPAWCRALTLDERAVLLDGHIDSSVNGYDQEMATKRLRRWQAQPQFEDVTILEQRLKGSGIDPRRLRQVLGTADEELYPFLKQKPSWLAALAQAYARPAQTYVNLEPGAEELGFLEIVQPLVDQACDRLFEGVEAIITQRPYFPFEPQAVEDILLNNLPDPLLLRLSRTMVLELNVARLQGHLSGATPAERFVSFVERLRKTENSLAILAEYPVLARQLVLCIDQWLEVGLEFLDRLAADWHEICYQFGLEEEPGPLRELIGGAGDTHRGGRSVMIARFESGFRVVYKPKSMAVDNHFQELLSWLNERGCQPPLRTMTILDRGEYGWVEYVEYEACQSQAEVGCFYQRLGVYLALLYAINASDFHLENLISCGPHPMLIDLETLFNPEFERFDEGEASDMAAGSMLRSVLAVGMLPQRLWSADGYGGIDISGLGGEEGQMSPDRIPRPAAAGTDEMRFERERVALEGESNRPRLNGAEASVLDYESQLLGGFRAMYQLLFDHRDALLAEDGPIARFTVDETRVLLRPTRTYDQLLFESFHPDTLRDALDRGLLLDRLWLVVRQRDYMAQAVGAEVADLLRGDIPVFTTHPSSHQLLTASGTPISGILIESGMNIARQRIEQLSAKDMQRQEWFIRSSLATLTPYEYGAEFQPLPPDPLQASVISTSYREMGLSNSGRSPLLAGARQFAEHLKDTAVLGSDDVSWLGLELLADESWDISPAGMDLYNGIPGIGLFLAYAGELLDDAQFTDLARRAVTAMQQHIELFAAELPGVGAFEGWGGILYVLTHLGALWQDESLLEQAEDLTEIIGRFVTDDEDYSISSGAAGAVVCLLALNACRPQSKALDTAAACGDHLLSSARKRAGGLCWATARYGGQDLAGFAHGAGGIAWALQELAAVTRNKNYSTTALQALAYERTHFSAAAQNWPDLRQNDPAAAAEPPRYPAAYCFGAAGAGLSRLAINRHLADEQLANEIETALMTTLNEGFGRSHCLCHGDLGNLELLLQAAQAGYKPQLDPEIERLKRMVIDGINRRGWQSGGPGGVEMPGLMLGSAGMGYQLLRLAAPDRMPSILLLAPPTA
ncbi:MAG: type 2 lanthipeptide synthetase LanM family protein [Candidatus Promineifilaceae bacterium]|nr:type 2 lanthipeptide synthetase LanM family protein [Candidatus Promineifilaceae bacterium]